VTDLVLQDDRATPPQLQSATDHVQDIYSLPQTSQKVALQISQDNSVLSENLGLQMDPGYFGDFNTDSLSWGYLDQLGELPTILEDEHPRMP
jgi:hypothetical protein